MAETRYNGETNGKRWMGSVIIDVRGNVKYSMIVGTNIYQWAKYQPEGLEQEIYEAFMAETKKGYKATTNGAINTTKRTGLCPICHTYCNGDCQASR